MGNNSTSLPHEDPMDIHARLNRPTMGSNKPKGYVADRSELLSDEIGAIVFTSGNAKLTKPQLERFIQDNMDYVGHYVKTQTEFGLKCTIGDGTYTFTFRKQIDLTDEQQPYLADKKKVLDLFHPTYFNTFYDLNDPKFTNMCDAAYMEPHGDDTPDHLSISETIKQNTEHVDDYLGAMLRQVTDLQEHLVLLRPEDVEDIIKNPLAYCTGLIKQFIETQKTINNAIDNNDVVWVNRVDGAHNEMIERARGHA